MIESSPVKALGLAGKQVFGILCCRFLLGRWLPVAWQMVLKYWRRTKLEMWANDQRDSRRAQYRWRPLFNAAQFGWRPLLKCCAVTLPRRKTRCANRSEPIVGWSSPYFENMWGRHCCLTVFFPIVTICHTCEDMARQSCAMVPRWQFFGSCICSEPRAVHFRPAS